MFDLCSVLIVQLCVCVWFVHALLLFVCFLYGCVRFCVHFCVVELCVACLCSLLRVYSAVMIVRCCYGSVVFLSVLFLFVWSVSFFLLLQPTTPNPPPTPFTCVGVNTLLFCTVLSFSCAVMSVVLVSTSCVCVLDSFCVCCL